MPGDNDIGGDEFKMVSIDKLRMFNNTFKTSDYLQYKYLSFTHVNRLSPYFSYNKNKDYSKDISIVLSHMPIILVPGLIVDKVSIFLNNIFKRIY